MKKIKKITITIFFILAFLLIITTNVKASEITNNEEDIEPLIVNGIDELTDALRTPETKEIILNDYIDVSEDIEIIVNGNDKILDLNGYELTLLEESKIKVNYYTNHVFRLNDSTLDGKLIKYDYVSKYSIFTPINYTDKTINMEVNGAYIEAKADWIFEDTNKFNLTINNCSFRSLDSLFKFSKDNESNITINRLDFSHLELDGKTIRLACDKYDNLPISSILGKNFKLVYNYKSEENEEYIDQPNTTVCGNTYDASGILIVMPIKGLQIDKVIVDPQEYGYSKPTDGTKIVIRNVSDDTITIKSVSLKDDYDNKFMILGKNAPDINPGDKDETFSIKPSKLGMKIDKYYATLLVKTTDGDIYMGDVEFEVTKIHQELSIDISNREYDGNAVEAKGIGKQGDAKDYVEYALKEEGKTIEQLDFSENAPINAGKYIVKYIVEDTDEMYAGGTKIEEFEITRKKVTPIVSGYDESYPYTGEKITPEVSVTLEGEEIPFVKGEDYIVEYGDNINAGEEKGIITIKSADTSNYIFDDIEEKFNITAKELLDSEVEVPEKIGHTGDTLTPKVKVTSDGKQLVEKVDYDVTFEGQDDDIGGQITVTVQGIGNYTGTIVKTVDIIERMNQGLAFTNPTVTKKYTDPKFTITPTHNVGDGKITYKSGNSKVIKVNETTGEVTIVGVGETEIIATASATELYKETSVSYKVKVNKADYDMSKVKFTSSMVMFDGNVHNIFATGLPAGVKVTYSNNGKTAVGIYTVTAIFTGDAEHYNAIPNKTATLVITFKDISGVEISGIKDKTYTGKKLTQAIVLKDGNITLREGIDYIVKYKSNKKIGTATITITGKGNYTGKIKRTFKITPKGTKLTKLTAGKKQFKVTWKKQRTETSGYEIQYSTDKNFKSGNKKVKIKKNKTTSSTVKKLKAKKKYYVRIRTYKVVNGKKYYSGWSKVLKVKTKK